MCFLDGFEESKAILIPLVIFVHLIVIMLHYYNFPQSFLSAELKHLNSHSQKESYMQPKPLFVVLTIEPSPSYLLWKFPFLFNRFNSMVFSFNVFGLLHLNVHVTFYRIISADTIFLYISYTFYLCHFHFLDVWRISAREKTKVQNII